MNMNKIYLGEGREYTTRDCAGGLWWVDITTNEPVGSWNFPTEEEAVAFVYGYELGTGAGQLPVLDELEE